MQGVKNGYISNFLESLLNLKGHIYHIEHFDTFHKKSVKNEEVQAKKQLDR